MHFTTPARAFTALFLSAGLCASRRPACARHTAPAPVGALRELRRAFTTSCAPAISICRSQDALALAIENNLDIELQRYMLPVATPNCCARRGGGVTRGLNYTLLEVPTGTGGPLSPVPTNAAAAGRATAGSSIATNALGLNVLGEPQVNLSIQGTIAAVHRHRDSDLRSRDGRTVELDPPDHAADQHGHYRHPTRWSPTPRSSMPGSSRASPSGAQVGLNFNNSRQFR